MNRAAFDRLYVGQRERVLALAFHMTGDRAAAEDVLQQTFLLAWKHRKAFRGEASAATWLYRIAIREASRSRRTERAAARREHRGAALHKRSASTPDEDAQHADEQRRLYAQLALLSAEHRAVLALLTLRGLTAERVGEILGVPANTVYSRAAAARRELRRLDEQDREARARSAL